MKKKQLLLVCLLAASVAGFAQVESKAPPPPPPPPAPSKAPPKVEMTRFIAPENDEVRAFYKRNPTVSSIRFAGEEKVQVVLKDKTVEKYDLADKENKASFNAKYGEAPSIPPPPPAKPPKVKKLPPPPPPPAPKKEA